jgi:hypothetical protein
MSSSTAPLPPPVNVVLPGFQVNGPELLVRVEPVVAPALRACSIFSKSWPQRSYCLRLSASPSAS